MTVFIVGLIAGTCCQAQLIDKVITEKNTIQIEAYLSSNAMEGRKTFTPAIDRAATYLASQMKSAGLQPLPVQKDYLQQFTMVQSQRVAAESKVNNVAVANENVLCISTSEAISFTEQSNYKLVIKKAGDNFSQSVRPYLNLKENVLILADTSFAAGLKSMQRFATTARFVQANNVVIALTGETNVTTYSVKIQQKLTEQKLANVVGMLRGKSRPEEYVIFSGHYDHLGYGKADETGDSLYNGANDDASGTTAVIMLARYYKKLNNNERTLVFVAFTAEEIGGFGSRYFSNQMAPEKVAAMFNIEMIGTKSKWGTNSAYITGYEKTNMGKILEKNLAGTAFKFYPDPYTQQQLFYRSDNATLARQGVPAHTISTSKMDAEPHYHKASDDISTLDMKNMTEVIKSIAISAQTIIAAKDTPTRVDPTQLR